MGPTCRAFPRKPESHQLGNCAQHVYICSSSIQDSLSAALIKQPPCEDPSRRTPSRNHQNQQKSDRPERSEKLELARVRGVDTVERVCLIHVCRPQLLMHVHLGEETYSHRDQVVSGFPTNSQNQTLLELS